MFARRRRGESASLGSSEELMASKEESEPLAGCPGLMVANDEEEGSAEWIGVGGRDTGRRPLGVSPPSDRFSQASSEDGRRGKLFA